MPPRYNRILGDTRPRVAVESSDTRLNKICTDINGSDVIDYKQLPKKIKYDTFRNKMTVYTLNDGITLTVNSDESKFTFAGNQTQVVLNKSASKILSYKHVDGVTGRETDIYLDDKSSLDLYDEMSSAYPSGEFINRIDVIGNLTISQYGGSKGRIMRKTLWDKVTLDIPYIPFFDKNDLYSPDIMERLKKAVVGFAENTTVEIRIYMNRDEKFLYVYLHGDILLIKCIRKRCHLDALEFMIMKPILETVKLCHFMALVAIVRDIVENIRGDKSNSISFVC